MHQPDGGYSGTKSFRQGLEVLQHFRTQLRILADAKTLELLSSMGPEPFTNGDARSVLLVKRQASWKKLAQLTEAGLTQKRGHSYRIAPFTHAFVEALSALTVSLLMGKEVTAVPPASKLSLEVALRGLEALYEKGKLSQDEYSRHRSAVEEMIQAVPPQPTG